MLALDSRSELVDFLKGQIKIENEIVRSLNSALRSIGNPPVKGTLKGISLDSVKHADMYASAIELLTRVPQAIKEEDLDTQRELVQKHIRIEEELIGRINEILPEVEDEKVRLLLNAILSDEKRHHELLKMVLEILVRGETITEKDWWEFIWQSTPFHGAPGG